MSEFDENKFIVINRKRFNELESEEGIITGLALIDCISRFRRAYEKDTGKKMNQRYIVCNQDEPYAEKVKAIILGTEFDAMAWIKEALPYITSSRDALATNLENCDFGPREEGAARKELARLDALIARAKPEV